VKQLDSSWEPLETAERHLDDRATVESNATIIKIDGRNDTGSRDQVSRQLWTGLNTTAPAKAAAKRLGITVGTLNREVADICGERGGRAGFPAALERRAFRATSTPPRCWRFGLCTLCFF
jgi:hypothetical protein